MRIKLLIAWTMLAGHVGAANLNVAVTSNQQASVSVEPGATVHYEVTAVLTDSNNEGLAAVLFDLSFSGGPLSPANEPTSNPMLNFDRPLGLTNPAGFGGSVVGGSLVQVGGAQNTIKNTIAHAPAPIGTVITGVGHTPVVVVTGSLSAPMSEGAYTLAVANVIAAAIVQGEDGSGSHWAVEPVGEGALSHLTINVAGVPVLTGQGVGPRYLAIEPPSGADSLALLVTGDSNNALVSCVSAYVQTDGTLAATPVFRTSAQWGSVVYVGDSEILPSTIYLVRADFGTPGNPILTAPLLMTTWRWGDPNNSGTVNLDDILCLLNAFAGTFTTCSLYSSDLQSAVPNRTINLDDILAVLGAFSGVAYPHPPPCP